MSSVPKVQLSRPRSRLIDRVSLAQLCSSVFLLSFFFRSAFASPMRFNLYVLTLSGISLVLFWIIAALPHKGELVSSGPSHRKPSYWGRCTSFVPVPLLVFSLINSNGRHFLFTLVGTVNAYVFSPQYFAQCSKAVCLMHCKCVVFLFLFLCP